MTGNTRKSKTLSPAAKKLRAILAENVSQLMALKFPIAKYGTESNQKKALAQAAENRHLSAAQRILNAQDLKATGIDMVADFATALECSPAELLTNGYAAAKLAGARHSDNGERELLQRRTGRSSP